MALNDSNGDVRSFVINNNGYFDLKWESMCNTCTWAEQTPAHNIWYGVENCFKYIITHNSYYRTMSGSISLYTPNTNTNTNGRRPMSDGKRRESNEHLSQNHAVLPTLFQQHNKRWTRAFLINRLLICMTFNLDRKQFLFYWIYQNEITKNWNQNGWIKNILLLIGELTRSNTIFFNVFFGTVFIHFYLFSFKTKSNWTLNTTYNNFYNVCDVWNN